MGFLSLSLCFSPSNHLPPDSRCINGCATLGSPFREFPVFPFYISHPSRAPRRCHLLSLFSCSALASSHPTPTPFSISLRLSNSPVLRLLQCLYQDQRAFLFSKLKGETEFTWPSAKASVNLTNISKHEAHRCWWEHSLKQNSHAWGTTWRCSVSGHETHTCIKVKSLLGYGLSSITRCCDYRKGKYTRLQVKLQIEAQSSNAVSGTVSCPAVKPAIEVTLEV